LSLSSFSIVLISIFFEFLISTYVDFIDFVGLKVASRIRKRCNLAYIYFPAKQAHLANFHKFRNIFTTTLNYLNPLNWEEETIFLDLYKMDILQSSLSSIINVSCIHGERVTVQ